MSLTQETQHVEKGLARLLTKWRDKPRYVAFITIILKRIQHIDDVIWDLFTHSWLDNAEGEQLNKLGAIVGELRKGRSDDVYRVYVKARIATNRSNGKIADTLKVARLILEAGAELHYIPEYPAAYKVTVTDTAVAAKDLSAILNGVRPAGVQLTTEVAASSSNAFILNTTTPLTNGFNHGLLADGV